MCFLIPITSVRWKPQQSHATLSRWIRQHRQLVNCRRNTDKSDGVTINEAEEGVRKRQNETATARGEVASVPRVSAGLLHRVGRVWDLFPWTHSLPDSLSAVPLSLQWEGDNWRESVDFHVYADMYFKHRYRPRPDRGSDVYCVTFESQWRVPPPVDTAREGCNESLNGAIDNPPPSFSGQVRGTRQ